VAGHLELLRGQGLQCANQFLRTFQLLPQDLLLLSQLGDGSCCLTCVCHVCSSNMHQQQQYSKENSTLWHSL
jgi:hypothetical protein